MPAPSPDIAGHAQGWGTPAAHSTRGPHQAAHATHITAAAVLQLQLHPAVLTGSKAAARAAAELGPAQPARCPLASITGASTCLAQAGAAGLLAQLLTETAGRQHQHQQWQQQAGGQQEAGGQGGQGVKGGRGSKR